MEGIVGRIDMYLRLAYRFVRLRRDVYIAGGIEVYLRSQCELTQRFAYRGHEYLEDSLLIGELDLRFRRMDVDIYRLRINVKIDEERRLVIRR